MQIFITGTDTDIGKTTVSSWLCRHSNYHYFKPIQTGSIETCDRQIVEKLAGVPTYPETYLFTRPLSPHAAAALEQQTINLAKITLPPTNNLIIEGAGGVLVPINSRYYMLDLIIQLQTPVIIVASSKLGTINHTLLTIAALKNRSVKILGVIMVGEPNQLNEQAIAEYGQVPILASLPQLSYVTPAALQQIPLTNQLLKLLL